MADLDPSLINRPVKAPDILGMAVQGMKLRELKNGIALQDQQIQDQQAIRDAQSQNTSVDDDGNVQVDRAGVYKSLSDAGRGNLIPKVQQDFAQRDSAVMNFKVNQAKAHIDFASQVLGGAKSQADYERGLQQMQAAGLPTDKYPPTWTPQLSQQIQNEGLSGKDQLDQIVKAQTAKAETLKAQAAAVEAGIPLGSTGGGVRPSGGGGGGTPSVSGQRAPNGQPGGNPPAQVPGAPFPGFTPSPKMMQKAGEDYNQAVTSSRQDPAAQQELKNILYAKNLNELKTLAKNGDLNQLNPQQTKLGFMELVKMAGSGVPSDNELNQMSVDNVKQMAANAWQKLTNKSAPANAGQFLQQAIDYANGIGKVSRTSLAQRSSDVNDRLRPFLGEGQYQLNKKQIANEFQGVGDETVNITLPDGRTGTIPKANLQKALSLGAKAM